MAKSEINETIEVGETSKVYQKHRDDAEDFVMSIIELLEGYPRAFGYSHYSPCCIYQVPKEQREMNEKAYSPEFISIGPFHHGTQKLLIGKVENKLQSFSTFLYRINDDKRKSLKVVTDKLYLWVKKEARSFYATPINIEEEEFVKMMLVDACFIVEFFINAYEGLSGDDKFSQIQAKTNFFIYKGVHLKILVDLIKLENQVPFVLLQNLFELIPTKYHKDGFVGITYMVVKMFGLVCNYNISYSNRSPRHLVDFLSVFFTPMTIVDMPNKEDGELWWSPPTITELFKAGVTIKVAKQDKFFMNISFKNGVLEIPRIVIDSVFEVFIRNLIVFEQFHKKNEYMHATQYALFLNNLIRTEKDVDLLVNAGVIINRNDKQVSELLNNICRFSSFSGFFYFEDINKDLHLHCRRKWNHDKALLKHNYFNTPWAIISLCAATLLLILTILQTIFSAISAFPS